MRDDLLIEAAAFLEKTTAPEVIDWTAFWSKDRPGPEWAHEPILAKGRGHSIFARHKVGKSLLALWLAVEMVKQGGAVLYLDFEMGEDDLHERLTDMGLGPETDLSLLSYALLPTLPPLDTDAGASVLGRMLDRTMAKAPDKHLTVVIDTFSRVVKGEENSNDTAQAFYRCAGLELKRRSVTWVRLDHQGWEGDHARGASAKGDDVDVVWRLAPTDSGLELVREAARIGWVPERVALNKLVDPMLTFVPVAAAWPLGARECAEDLDALGVDLDASVRVALAALRDAGRGRRQAVVQAALKWRRIGRDTPRDTPPMGGAGHTQGHAPLKAHNQGADTPRDTPGHSDGAGSGHTVGPLGDTPVPGEADTGDLNPADVWCDRCERRNVPTGPGEPYCRCPASEVLAAGLSYSIELEHGPDPEGPRATPLAPVEQGARPR